MTLGSRSITLGWICITAVATVACGPAYPEKADEPETVTQAPAELDCGYAFPPASPDDRASLIDALTGTWENSTTQAIKSASDNQWEREGFQFDPIQKRFGRIDVYYNQKEAFYADHLSEAEAYDGQTEIEISRLVNRRPYIGYRILTVRRPDETRGQYTVARCTTYLALIKEDAEGKVMLLYPGRDLTSSQSNKQDVKEYFRSMEDYQPTTLRPRNSQDI